MKKRALTLALALLLLSAAAVTAGAAQVEDFELMFSNYNTELVTNGPGDRRHA